MAASFQDFQDVTQVTETKLIFESKKKHSCVRTARSLRHVNKTYYHKSHYTAFVWLLTRDLGDLLHSRRNWSSVMDSLSMLTSLLPVAASQWPGDPTPVLLSPVVSVKHCLRLSIQANQTDFKQNNISQFFPLSLIHFQTCIAKTDNQRLTSTQNSFPTHLKDFHTPTLVNIAIQPTKSSLN